VPGFSWQAAHGAFIQLRVRMPCRAGHIFDAFGAELSEPRSKQKSITEMHQFACRITWLTSHIATLAYYAEPLARGMRMRRSTVVDDIVYGLERSWMCWRTGRRWVARQPAKESCWSSMRGECADVAPEGGAGCGVAGRTDARKQLRVQAVVDQFILSRR